MTHNEMKTKHIDGTKNDKCSTTLESGVLQKDIQDVKSLSGKCVEILKESFVLYEVCCSLVP